ncbi:ADP-ribosylglycohydrolase family protein [Methanobacterium sp. ACI-7]|uniref:ADP-ribosylglycohydrolase family protein n=1 Tax=unclassified Methanobacterium TaxID=2627676 RepID=UPI0039C287BA
MKEEIRIPSIKNMDQILSYLPYFSSGDNEFYKISSKLSIDPYIYSDKTSSFISDIYKQNFTYPFNWTDWSREAQKYLENHDLISYADIQIIQKLFTTLIRSDRFCSGVIASNIDDGTILELLKRIKEIKNEFIDRARGSLIGLAVGDALGVPLEFKSPGTFDPISDMIGGGSFHLKPGEWTDDTSMALCLAESLIEKQGFNLINQLEKYCKWYRSGYLSVNGRCFDIGNTTRDALHKFEDTKEPFCGPTHERSAGNGSIMRLAPVPIYYFWDPKKAIQKAGESSRTTHGHILAVDACKYTSGIIVGAIIGHSKEEISSRRYSPVYDLWNEDKLAPEIDKIACGSFKNKNPPEIQGSGYVVKSLEAALWAFYNSDSFEEGCLKAVNLGDDADTTGAVYGQIAGAYYGESAIPVKWKNKLAKFELIDSILNKLIYNEK